MYNYSLLVAPPQICLSFFVLGIPLYTRTISLPRFADLYKWILKNKRGEWKTINYLGHNNASESLQCVYWNRPSTLQNKSWKNYCLELDNSKASHWTKWKFYCLEQDILLAEFKNAGIYHFSSAIRLIFFVWVTSVSVNGLFNFSCDSQTKLMHACS